MQSENLRRDSLLLASPSAMEDESVGSWIQYVCAMHQYSFTRLKSVLGFMPGNRDWDRHIAEPHWRDLLRRAVCPENTCSRARQAFSNTRSQKKPFLTESPNYQWCVECLESDARPYLRWWWKSAGEIFCPAHRIFLSSTCERCNGVLILDRALLVAAGNPCPIPDLLFCQHCGMPRGGQRNSRWNWREIDYRILAIQNTYVATPGGSNVILRAVLKDEELRRWKRSAFFSRISEILSHADRDFLRAWKAAATKHRSVSDDAAGLSDLTPTTSRRLGWSRQIPKSQTSLRLKLAYALAVYRKEKFRLRREGNAAFSQVTVVLDGEDG